MLEGFEISEQIREYITLGIGLVISLMIKDFMKNFLKGIAFRMNPLFKEGDLVLVDDEPAIVVRIGIRNTTFGVEKATGESTWMSVDNARIPYLKIEKVVRSVVGSRGQNVYDASFPNISTMKEKTDEKKSGSNDNIPDT
jgi:hypothetical protein